MRASAMLTAAAIGQADGVERAMDDPDAIGRTLRRLRAAHPLTQAALAQRAACSLATIKKIEAGLRRPSPQLAARFAACLGLAGEARAAFLAATRTSAAAMETVGTLRS